MSIDYNGYSNSSIQLPTTYEEVLGYIKRKLGEPVLQTNLDDSQIYDRIGDALQFFRDWNDDGSTKEYIVHALTQEEIDNNSLLVANNVIEVTNVLKPISVDKNILTDITYHIRNQVVFSDFWRGGNLYLSEFLTSYTLLMTRLQEIEDNFHANPNIRFNRFTNKLHYDLRWSQYYNEGDLFVYEAYVLVDPEVYPRILSNRLFLGLASAYTKMQLGEVLNRHNNVAMLGGVVFQSDRILKEAENEIEKYEGLIRSEAKAALPITG